MLPEGDESLPDASDGDEAFSEGVSCVEDPDEPEDDPVSSSSLKMVRL